MSELHTLEQLSFSICMQKNGVLIEADEVIQHYWNKLEKEYINKCLNKDQHETRHGIFSCNNEIWLKLKLITLNTRMHISYDFAKINAITNFENNKFHLGYYYSLIGIIANFKFDLKFRDVFILHFIRHLKHVVKYTLRYDEI